MTFRALGAAPGNARSAARAAHRPLSRAGSGNMDEGWTRWLLEQYRVQLQELCRTPTSARRLRRLDIIVFADEEADEILNGHLPGTMPDEYVGGISVEGAAICRRFVERGGWVLAWTRRSDFAIDSVRAAGPQRGEGYSDRRSSSFPAR